jgi:hypothetical protein
MDADGGGVLVSTRRRTRGGENEDRINRMDRIDRVPPAFSAGTVEF